MVKKLITRINVRFQEHMDAIEVHRRLVTFSDDISVL